MTKIYFCVSKGVKVDKGKARRYCKHRFGKGNPCGALIQIPRKNYKKKIEELYERGHGSEDM